MYIEAQILIIYRPPHQMMITPGINANACCCCLVCRCTCNCVYPRMCRVHLGQVFKIMTNLNALKLPVKFVLLITVFFLFYFFQFDLMTGWSKRSQSEVLLMRRLQVIFSLKDSYTGRLGQPKSHLIFYSVLADELFLFNERRNERKMQLALAAALSLLQKQ